MTKSTIKSLDQRTKAKPTILVVDDEESLRLTTRFSLENSGFSILEAESGEEALEIFTQQRPELILMDVIMGGMDGFSACRSIRNQVGGEFLPVIMMTSLEDEKTINEAFTAGATDFVSKPINLLILSFRIRYWLRSSNALTHLQLSEQRLSKAQKIAKLAHWEWDLPTGTFKVHGHQLNLFGLDDIFTYNKLLTNVVTEDRDLVSQTLESAEQNKKPFAVQYRVVDDAGDEHTILNQGEFREKDINNEWYAFGVVQDITELENAESRIRYLAYYDSLTGLANRSLFKEYWNKVELLNKRNCSNVAVMFIDLDHFKQVNDTLGHPIGDQVLINVAERLKVTLRKSDIIGRGDDLHMSTLISRVGGDEFTLLASNLNSPEDAAIIAGRILEILSEPFEVEGHELNLSASIGISLYPDDGENIDTLLKHADTAMYEAKNKGRNNFQFFHNEMNAVVQARFNLQNKLRKAIDQGEFELYYQPKYSNSAKKIKGVEALIRWIDPKRGIVPPNDFLPFAEENNLINTINTWVIKEACKQAKYWVQKGCFENRTMSFNVSGKDINFKDLEETIRSSIREFEIEPHYLELELTERVMMDNPQEAKRALQNLKELGISIAIDDFGTGYSALSHLQVFPLTTLKIDRSFVNNIEATKNGKALLLSIVNIAKSLDLKVVAEGVETENQRSILQNMKCDELQGFLMSRPIPAQEAEDLLLKMIIST